MNAVGVCREGKGLLGCRLVLEVVGVQADVDDAFGAADPFEDVSLESRGLGLDDGDDSTWWTSSPSRAESALSARLSAPAASVMTTEE